MLLWIRYICILGFSVWFVVLGWGFIQGSWLVAPDVKQASSLQHTKPPLSFSSSAKKLPSEEKSLQLVASRIQSVSKPLDYSQRRQQYFQWVEQIAPLESYDYQSLQAFYQQIWQQQEKFFTPAEIERYFGEQRRIGEMVLLQAQLAESDLSDAQREEIYQAWLSEQPQHWQRVDQDNRALKQLNEFDLSKHSRVQVHEAFPPQVADRLIKLQEKREDLKTRYQVFKKRYDEIAEIFNDPVLIDHERNLLLEQHFTSNERRRVDVWLRHETVP